MEEGLVGPSGGGCCIIHFAACREVDFFRLFIGAISFKEMFHHTLSTVDQHQRTTASCHIRAQIRFHKSH